MAKKLSNKISSEKLLDTSKLTEVLRELIQSNPTKLNQAIDFISIIDGNPKIYQKYFKEKCGSSYELFAPEIYLWSQYNTYHKRTEISF